MNSVEQILVKIPITEITIKTTIHSQAVIQRIEHGVKPTFHKLQRGAWDYFTFRGSAKGNFFVVKADLKDREGNDVFKNKVGIGVLFVRMWINLNTTPVFYGRVFDTPDGGSLIQGHFGMPLPTMGLVCILVLALIGRIYPSWSNPILVIGLFLLLASVVSLMEFAVERKGLLDFLRGLFDDVLET